MEPKQRRLGTDHRNPRDRGVPAVEPESYVAHGEKPVRGRLLKMAEAAEKTGMSSKWIYAHMVKGTLPFPWFMPSPGKRLIDSADIEDWLRLIKIPAGKLPGEI